MPASVAPSDSSTGAKPRHYFATTHWSVVLSAGRSDTTSAHLALESLCRTYWYPLYAYARRRGYSAHDAEDMTQAFFAHLLDRKSVANADPNKGRFRSFILGAMTHYLANESVKLRAQKRGAGKEVLSLDAAAAEERFDLEPATGRSPDETFDKEWATALLNKVLNALEEDFRRQNKSELFAALKQTLAGSRADQPYAMLAKQLEMNEGAVKTAVHRLRKRYRQLLEAEIANTVASPAEIKEELAYLLKIMAS
ncbi:MAG: RNA polymerase subunit sigma-24 [Verrucomicrobia bacterium]|nr:MAG: RNA polymerase subunit sigma-24 [Verrucomicrobiota bacterium]